MIKGKQIQTTKRGGILLTLQRELVKPDDVDGKEWSEWLTRQPRSYQLEADRPFWTYVWPQVVANVNICLAREKPSCVMREAKKFAVWIRIADDIIISVYDPEAARYLPEQGKDPSYDGPFYRGHLRGLLRIPIEWWNDNIDDVTSDILELSKVMIAS